MTYLPFGLDGCLVHVQTWAIYFLLVDSLLRNYNMTKEKVKVLLFAGSL